MSPRMRVNIGLTSVLVSVLLGAMVFQLVPDQRVAIMQGRSRLAESVAVNSSVLIARDDVRRMQAILTVLVERHEDILSAGLRRESGELVVEVGPHDAHWRDFAAQMSDESQIYVPLNDQNGKWGGLELRFKPLRGTFWEEIFLSHWARLIYFVSGICFVFWYFYLGRILAQLNPSQAVPARVRSALDTLTEGLLVLDRRGRIVLCNQALSQTLGESPDALIGRPAYKLPWDAEEGCSDPMFFPWTPIFEVGEKFTTGTLRLRDTNGDLHIYRTNCSPVMGQEDQIRGVVCGFEDVTELEAQKVELAASKADAEAANQAKSAFLANMSHEIRTPMNAIMGFTEVLRRSMYDNAEQRTEYLDIIHSSSEHLLHLINDILDLSKVEAGRLEVESIECSPHKLLLDVVTVLGVRAEEKHISLTCLTPEGLPEVIETDPSRLRQVITNLIGNAIKFTSEGGITVTARMLYGSVPMLQIDVTDTGIGISESAQKSIFDPFSQADGSITRRFGGTGLGLTISRHFSELMGGGLSVRSTPGEGSTFTVTVRAGLAARDSRVLDISDFRRSVERTDKQHRKQHYAFGPSRILLVDDGEANRQLIQLVLQKQGLQVETATNGQEAVDLATARSYDVILMDMQMPVMDGYSATRHLRQQGLQVPIVALTANAMHGDEEKCRAAGCTGFLSKPVDLDELLAYLAEILGAVAVEIPAANAVTAAASSDHSSVDHDGPVIGTDAVPAARPAPASSKADISRSSVQPVSRLEAAVQLIELPALDAAAQGSHRGTSRPADLNVEPGSGQPIHPMQIPTVVVNHGIGSQSGPVSQSGPRRRASDHRRGDQNAPIRSRLPLDDPEFLEIVVGFVDRLREQVDELTAAWKRSDIERVAEIAHWLKGAAGTVGFDEFTAPALDLMHAAREHRKNDIGPAISLLDRMMTRIELPQPI